MSSIPLAGNLKTRLVSSLKAKLMVAFLITAFIPIIVVSVVIGLQASQALETNLFSYLEGISQAKGQNIAAKIQARKREVETAANSMRLATIMISHENSTHRDEDETCKQLLDSLNKILREKKEFEEIYVVNPSGIIRESTNPDNKDKDINASEYFKRGCEETCLESGLSSEATGDYRVLIASPIRSHDGKLLGVLAARLNLADLYEIVADVTGLRTTGMTLVGILDGEQARIVSPLRNEKQSSFNIRVDQESVPIRAAFKGGKGQGIVPDYRGKKVVAVWQHVPDINWALVTKIDLEEFQEPLMKWRSQVFYLGLVALVITGIGAHLFSAKIVRPIVALTEAAERVSRRDINVKIDIESEDEIGKLAASFSRMVSAIKFYKDMGEGKA
jgi:methyl-accepting chemotaxis protein WspA